MQVLKTNKRFSKYLLTFLFFSLLIFIIYSCKKTDTLTDLVKTPQQNFHKKDFFELPPDVSNPVKRVAEELKKQNEIKEFVTSFAKYEGYPIWEKAYITIATPKPPKGNNGTALPTTGFSSSVPQGSADTIVYIPLVLDNGDHVNAFIRARITDTVAMKIFDQRDYANFPYQTLNPATATTAENYALRMMQMDNDVFGYTEFEMKDKGLFGNCVLMGDTSRVKRFVKFNSETGNNFANVAQSSLVLHTVCVTLTTTTTTYNCPYGVGNCGGPGGSCDHCPSCTQTSSTYSMQCETWWEEEGGGGWPFYPTGGGGGGGYPPAPPPCTTNFTNNFSIPGTNNVVPINPYPPINNPWPPVPPPPPFCDPFVDALSANTNFVNIFHWLNTSGPNQPLGLNYEVGVEIRDVNQYNNSNYITKYGAPDTKTVDFYLQANTLQAGFLHSHYSGLNSMFTADDIILLATTFMTNHAKDTNNLFMGLTSSYSTPFIMKVGNVAKFRQFCTKIVGANGLDSLKKEDFKDKYDRKVDSYDPDANEKAFLEMVKEYGGEDGLNLLSGNIACNQWTKRRIDNFGAVKNVPSCN